MATIPSTSFATTAASMLGEAAPRHAPRSTSAAPHTSCVLAPMTRASRVSRAMPAPSALRPCSSGTAQVLQAPQRHEPDRFTGQAAARGLRQSSVESGDSQRSWHFTPRAYRLAAVLVGLFAIVGMIGVFDTSSSGSANATTTAVSSGRATVWVVQPGDTYWTIARALQPSGDVRPLVDQLQAANDRGSLQPGQHVPLP